MSDFEKTRPANTERSKDRYALLQRCGFPLQDRLERAVLLSTQRHGWNLLGSEYPLLRDRRDQPVSFIDLVLAKQFMRMIIEVKKKSADEFIFPVPEAPIPPHSFLTMESFRDARIPEILECRVKPNLPFARFALVTREDALSVSTVDRNAVALIQACEDLAREWTGQSRPVIDYAQVFIPVVVTSARLVGAVYDPLDVDLESGEIPAEMIRYTEVDAVRYQKPLPSSADSGWVIDVDRLYPMYPERTVFVVRASRFTAWLEEFELAG